MEEYHGHWWNAGRPNQKVHGVLRVSEDGELQLDTFGALAEDTHFRGAATSAPGRILGQLENSTGVTLDGCLLRRAHVMGETPRESWIAHQVVFGLHFDPNEPWAFCGASFSIPLLTSWVAPRSAEVSMDFDADGRVQKIGVATLVDRLPLWEIGSHMVELAKSAGVKDVAEGITELTARFDVRSLCPAPVAADDFFGTTIRPLQLLIGLSTGTFTAPVRGQVYNEPQSASVPLRGFDRRWHSQDAHARAADATYGFSYADFAGLPHEVRSRWLERLRTLRPVIDLYLATLQSRGYAEQNFVFIVQALETYHRISSAGSIVSEEMWNTLRGQLSACVDSMPHGFPGRSRALAALNGKLQYLNEPGLRARLKQLIASLGEMAKDVVGADVAGFVGRVTDTRNYYTHWTVELAPKAMRDTALFHASLRLQAVLEVLLLREVGFADDSSAIREVVRRRVAWIR